MKERYISNAFGYKLLEKGKITSRYEAECDNGHVEMIAVTYTNGVDFLIMKLNGEIILVS